MILSYDPYLVGLSILIAISASYTCFHLVDRLTKFHGIAWKAALLAASLSVGGGIWSTHFVGMLALNLPIEISYDLLETLLSVMVAVSFTAFALYFYTIKSVTPYRTAFSGCLLGLGISGMHFIGMEAIVANCTISYDALKVLLAVGVGIAASILALYLSLKIRGRWEQFPAAVAMGLGIACMHYTGMFSASFEQLEEILIIEQAALDRSVIAIVIAALSFAIFGSTFLLATPGPYVPSRMDEKSPEEKRLRISVKNGQTQLFFEPTDIQCIHANGRYTEVVSEQGNFFCDLSISKLEELLSSYGFLRVHRSHLVNLKKITFLGQKKDRGFVSFHKDHDKELIPVSRSKIEILKSELKSLGLPF